MTFTIDQIYKEGVPRKQFYRSEEVTLSTSATSPLTISPSTTPQWAILLEEIRIFNSSMSTSGAGSGYFSLAYPNYEGDGTEEIVVNDESHLDLLTNEVNTVNGNTIQIIKFKPPILLKASNAESTMTVGLPSDVVVDSGTLRMLASGWNLKEIDY